MDSIGHGVHVPPLATNAGCYEQRRENEAAGCPAPIDFSGSDSCLLLAYIQVQGECYLDCLCLVHVAFRRANQAEY